MPKRATSGGIHLRGLELGQHSSEGMLPLWQAIDDTESDFIGSGIEPQTSLAKTDGSNYWIMNNWTSFISGKTDESET